MRTREMFAWVVMLSAVGCTVNGKPLSWPKKNGDTTATSSDGSSDSSSDSEPVATKVTAERPGWCNVEGSEELDAGGVEYTLKDDDPRDQVFDLTGHFCSKYPETEQRDALVALHAKLSKQLMMNDADWKDAVEWAMHAQIERNAPSLRVDDKMAYSKMDGIQQYAAFTSSYDSIDFLADELDSKLTAIGRMGYVEKCLSTDDIGQWAICHADVVAFDPDAIAAEIRGSKSHDGYERTVVRLQMNALRAKVKARIDAVKELTDKDPGYKKLFDTTAETRAAWKPDSLYAEIALDMADAKRTNSRSAFTDCGEHTWTAFSKAVAGQFPAKRFNEITKSEDRSFFEKAVSVVLDNENVYLAAYAMLRCATGTDTKLDPLLRTLGDEMQWRPGLRGPRTAAHTAGLAAGIVLDDRDARIEWPTSHRDFPGSSGYSGGGHGVIAKVDENSKGVTISFAKEMAKYQECTKWKTTGRIDRIDANGNLYYEEYCTKYVTKSYNEASAPQTVSARYNTRLDKGNTINVIEDVVTEVRAKKSGDVVAVFGVAVD